MGTSEQIEGRARRNLEPYGEKAEVLKGEIRSVLRQPRWTPHSVDVAYIDGDDQALACLRDSALVWPLIKPG